MKILISGLGKSGTTALFFRIKNSMPENTKTLFEPEKYIPHAHDQNKAVLAKILLYKPQEIDYESFSCFDKKILIIRDPRDRLISMLLYRAWNSFYGDDHKVSKFLELLRKKELRPSSVSVLNILRMINKFETHAF